MRKNKDNKKKILTTIPALLTTFLAISCPVCWPAYALFLSSVGLGFMNRNEYLFEIVTTAVIITNVVMTWTGVMYKTFVPIVLTVIGSILILSGRFNHESSEMLYSGTGILILATVWNLVKAKQAAKVCSTSKDQN